MKSFEKMQFDELAEVLRLEFEPFQEPQFYSCEGSPMENHVGRVVEVLETK
jgi:hypothetical protein